MTGMEIIEVVIAIWVCAFLALVGIQIKNLINAVELHTRAIYRLIRTMEGTDEE